MEKTLVEVRLATSKGELGIRLDKNLFKLVLPLRGVFWHMSLEGQIPFNFFCFSVRLPTSRSVSECFAHVHGGPKIFEWRNALLNKASEKTNEHALFLLRNCTSKCHLGCLWQLTGTEPFLTSRCLQKAAGMPRRLGGESRSNEVYIYIYIYYKLDLPCQWQRGVTHLYIYTYSHMT